MGHLGAIAGVLSIPTRCGRNCLFRFGTIKSALEQSGSPLDDMDLMIGATTFLGNLILVTNNLTHFRKIDGLRIENWKTGESIV